MQRLKLKPEKITQLGAGLRSIAAQDEPVGKILSCSFSAVTGSLGEISDQRAA